MDKRRIEPLAKILFAVAMLLGALTVLKIAGFFVASSKAKAVTIQADPNEAGPGGLQDQIAQAKTSAEQLKKNNLFILPAARQHPVNEVLGILGSEALIDDKWYKVGDSVGEARIVAIEPTKVRIAWDGQEKEFMPIGSGGSGGPPGPRMPASVRPGPAPGAEVVVAGARRGPPRSEREGPPFVSTDEREKLRQRWENMSAEEKQQFRNEMREKFGRRER